MQPFRRVKAHAHAGGRAHGDDRAGEQGHAAAELGDDIRDVKDHQIRGAVLPQLAVDAAPDAVRLAHVEFLRCHDPRAHRREAVETLAAVPLLVLVLDRARAHII